MKSVLMTTTRGHSSAASSGTSLSKSRSPTTAMSSSRLSRVARPPSINRVSSTRTTRITTPPRATCRSTLFARSQGFDRREDPFTLMNYRNPTPAWQPVVDRRVDSARTGDRNRRMTGPASGECVADLLGAGLVLRVRVRERRLLHRLGRARHAHPLPARNLRQPQVEQPAGLARHHQLLGAAPALARPLLEQ